MGSKPSRCDVMTSPFARAMVDAGGAVPYVRMHGTFPTTTGESGA